MQYEDLFEHVGHFGKYQIYLYILLGLPAVFPGYQNVAMNFLGAHQDHWCKVPRLVNFTHQEQKYIAIPKNNLGHYKSCRVFDIDFNNYTNEELKHWNRSWTENATEKSCSQWVYDQSEFTSTATSQVD